MSHGSLFMITRSTPQQQRQGFVFTAYHLLSLGPALCPRTFSGDMLARKSEKGELSDPGSSDKKGLSYLHYMRQISASKTIAHSYPAK
jgi:hypothetical protein